MESQTPVASIVDRSQTIEVQPSIVSETSPIPLVDNRPKANNFLVVLLSILLFISFSIAAFFAYRTQQLVKELQMAKEAENKKQLITDTLTNLPFKIDNLKAGDMISSPLLISGTIDRSWTFESMFSIEIQDQNRNSLNTIPVNTVFSGDQNQHDSFSEVIQFVTTEATGFIIIRADNPSGLSENDKQIEIPVKFYNSVDTSDWKTYVDITNKFEIKYPSDWTTAKETKNKDSYTQIVDLAKTVESTFYNSDGKHALWISYIKNPNNLSLNQIIKSGMLDKNYGTLSTSFANEDIKFTELNIGNNKVYYPDINKWPSAFGIRSVFILNPSNNSYAWINLEPREDSSLDPIMDQIISTFEFTN